jgi:hypothetical protein
MSHIVGMSIGNNHTCVTCNGYDSDICSLCHGQVDACNCNTEAVIQIHVLGRAINLTNS